MDTGLSHYPGQSPESPQKDMKKGVKLMSEKKKKSQEKENKKGGEIVRAIKVSWAKSKTFTILTLLYYPIAIFFIYVIFLLPSIELKIAAGGVAFAIASITSTDLKNVLDKQKIDQILDKLSGIEDLQKEIQLEQKEQKEREDSRQPIIASIEAFTQLYMDYIAKQKEGENEKS